MSSHSVNMLSAPEQLFVENLPLIDRILGVLSRRAAFSADDAEDFRSWAHERLIEDDYAVLRTFAGRSALATFLAVVLHNVLHDYRNARWGRWRPSAAALRHGPFAVRLEELVTRDGCPLREATEILRAAGCRLSDGEIARLAARLPRRTTAHEVPLDAVADGPTARHACIEPRLEDDVTRDVSVVVRAVMDDLPPEDALLLRMRFWSDLSVAEISRTLRLEQKPLYRRLDALHARLRGALGDRGVDQTMVADLLDVDARR